MLLFVSASPLPTLPSSRKPVPCCSASGLGADGPPGPLEWGRQGATDPHLPLTVLLRSQPVALPGWFTSRKWARQSVDSSGGDSGQREAQPRPGPAVQPVTLRSIPSADRGRLFLSNKTLSCREVSEERGPQWRPAGAVEKGRPAHSCVAGDSSWSWVATDTGKLKKKFSFLLHLV